MALVLKNLPVNAGDISGVGLIPGSGRFPEGGHGNPLQYSCLENPLDRGGWQAAVRMVRYTGWLNTCSVIVWKGKTTGVEFRE